MAHLLCAIKSYNSRGGTAYGAAIGGVVLANDQDLLEQVQTFVLGQVRPTLHQQALDPVDSATASRTAVGLTGLAAADYSGLEWMRYLREALTFQHGDVPAHRGVLRVVLYDFAALAGLSVGLAACGALAFVRPGILLTACDLDANLAAFLAILARNSPGTRFHCTAFELVSLLTQSASNC